MKKKIKELNSLKSDFCETEGCGGILTTLVVTLASLKQSELPRIVHHRKLFEQSLDDLTGRGARADVQVLGCIFWQVERGSTLDAGPLLPPTVVTSFLGGVNGHGASQLELHLHEAGVGAVLVLSTTETFKLNVQTLLE